MPQFQYDMNPVGFSRDNQFFYHRTDAFQLHQPPSEEEELPASNGRNGRNLGKLMETSENAGSLSPRSQVQVGLSHKNDTFKAVLNETIGPSLPKKSSCSRFHSKSDNLIRRASSVISLKLGPLSIQRLSVHGLISNKFRSIFIIILFCLVEALTISFLYVSLYVAVTKAKEPDTGLQSVHVLLTHLMFTPLLYSYGFTPLKNRIKRFFKFGAQNESGTVINDRR